MPVSIVSLLLQEYKSLVFDHLQIAPTADRPPSPQTQKYPAFCSNTEQEQNVEPLLPAQINDFSSSSCVRQSVGVSDPARCLLRSGWPFVLSVNGIFWCLISTGVFFFFWTVGGGCSRCSGPPCALSRVGRQRQRGRPSKRHQDPAGHQTTRLVPDRSVTHWLTQQSSRLHLVFPSRWRSKTSAERCSPTSGWLGEGFCEGRRQMEVWACE